MWGARAGRDVRMGAGGGDCGGVHGLTVMRFCPEAQSLARRPNPTVAAAFGRARGGARGDVPGTGGRRVGIPRR